MELQVYRNREVVAVLNVSGNTVFTHQLMGEHKITATDIVTTDVLNIQLSDYIQYQGERYTINTVPGFTKISNINYRYDIVFEAPAYRLYDKKLMQNGEFVTDYFGYPKLYLQLIVDNMNQIDSGWKVGTVEAAEEKHVAFTDRVSCRAALTAVAEAFGMEYYFTGKTIHLVKAAGEQTSLRFSQGKGNGLYTFALQSRDDANLVTRVYGFGGTRNIPSDYRMNEAGIGALRLRIGAGYLENNTALYGVKEGIYQNEEIFPNRTSTLTDAFDVGNNTFFVADATLDFDINEHLMEGLDAKVAFKTGDLAGYEFTISSYDHSTKVFRLNVDKEQKPNPMPNPTFVPKKGDAYTLIDIRMPQLYVDQAEAKLLEETQIYLAENSRPSAVFNLNLDELYVKNNGIRLKPGDRVQVLETDLGIDAMIRTISVSWPLLNPNKISATIADFVPYTRQERLVRETIENRTETIIVDRVNAERARRTAAQLRALRGLIQDPDDYFNTDQLRPGSIETLFLSVGAKSQNFGLNNVRINANANADPNSISISDGQLIHYEIQIEGLGYVWQMQEGSFTGLDPDKAYYIAAKCERTALRGTWSVTESFKTTEAEPGVWYFNLGVLYPVKEGHRDYDLTKGMTTIVGENITTGKVQSLDKINFFNLTNGTFNLGEGATGMDYGVTTPGVLTIKKSIMAEKVEVGSEGVVNAYISGITDNGPLSVRFSAGKNGEFQVLDNGDVYLRKAYMKDGCELGDFVISGGGMMNLAGKAYIVLRGQTPNNTEVRLGANVFTSGDSYSGAAYFKGKGNGGLTDNALAAYFDGPTYFEGAFIIKPTSVTSNVYQATKYDSIIHYRPNYNGTIYLPKYPHDGQVIEIRKHYNVKLQIHGGYPIKAYNNSNYKIIDASPLERFQFLKNMNCWIDLTY